MGTLSEIRLRMEYWMMCLDVRVQIIENSSIILILRDKKPFLEGSTGVSSASSMLTC